MAPPASLAASGGTRVALPPPKPKVPPSPVPGGSVSVTPTIAAPSASSDPKLLLDAFDSYTANTRRVSSVAGVSEGSDKSKTGKGDVKVASPSSRSDPVDFLNRYFTTEATFVAQLPAIRDAVAERMDGLDDRISSALHRQSETSEITQRHVQDAKASVASLEQRIYQIKSKASLSERAVRDITKDMKRLDCAKRNLQRTITTLKKLHMLVHAVEQLRLACLVQPVPDFAAAAHLVDATRLLLSHFDPYKDKVDPIKLLSQKVSDLHGELRASVLRGFRAVAFGSAKTLEMEQAAIKASNARNKKNDKGAGTVSNLIALANAEGKRLENPTSIVTPTVLQGGTKLVDSLGIGVRNDFIRIFNRDHLSEYQNTFQPVAKQAAKAQPRVSSFKAAPEPPKEEPKPDWRLETMDVRFGWYRNLFRNIHATFPQVFPPYWNVHYHLTQAFFRVTRKHILALLNGPTMDTEAGNATVLLKSLQMTILFEKEMSALLVREYGTMFKAASKDETTNVVSKNLTRTAGDANGSDEKEAVGSKVAKTEGGAPTEQSPVDPLLGLASSAFDNYMGPYIALEEQSMDELLVESLEDRKVDTRGELPVFITSTNLFVYIKGSITRCTALTKGNCFFLLHQAFQGSLKKYAQVLSSKLPPATSAASVGGLSIGNVHFTKQDGSPNEASYKIPPGEEITVCHVISTCEYCADTVEALEDLIRDTIDDEFKDKVDMMAQQEVFHDITAKSVRVLVSGLENRLDNAMKSLASINWGACDEVGEESDYVSMIHQEIQPYVTTARDIIPISYFRSFCDKFALLFTNSYYEALVRLKRISEPGTQQLLLDVYSLKTLFLKIPVLEKAAPAVITSPSRKAMPSGSTIAPAMYTKMVQKQFKKIETLLKLVGTPVELLIDVFRVQWVGGTASELQSIMALKGMKRSEQAAMLEKFGLDPATALRGAHVNVTSASLVSERLQAVQDQAARVTDLNQMRQKVDKFRKQALFR